MSALKNARRGGRSRTLPQNEGTLHVQDLGVP
jgi:hypothetical protein